MVIKMGHPKARKILWHDGFHTNIKDIVTDKEFEKYTDSIIKFAGQYDYDTVSITAFGANKKLGLGAFLPDQETAYKYINRFIAKAEDKGLSVGLNVYQQDKVTGTVDQLVNDISENITHTKPLTFGIDYEVNDITAKELDTNKDIWIKALDKHIGENNYDDFMILGGFAQPSTWKPSSNFKNAWEYYSVDGDNGTFNKTISGDLLKGKYLNNPAGALQYIQNNIKATCPKGKKGKECRATHVADPITGGEYNGLVPVFSIGTGKGNALGNLKKKTPIGPAVFGTWEPEPFDQFISAWNEAYPDTTDIIVYHGDQLPTTWYEYL